MEWKSNAIELGGDISRLHSGKNRKPEQILLQDSWAEIYE